MGLFDDAVPGGNLAKPVMVALGALLVGKMMGGFGGSDATPKQAQAPGGTQGGFAAGGATSGGLMGGLGGLLERLTKAGQGDVANSWVGTGPNKPIEPQQLGSAIGQTTLADLARQTGMSEQELLNHLARTLPTVVDRATPNGRIPSPGELRSMFG
jgi:uncharacterized protein YidB (DUF937 family)